jgi:hypothetical protein
MNTQPSVRRSDFVTVLAWVLIAFNGFGVLGALLQNLMMNFVMPSVLAHAPADPALDDFPLTVFRVVSVLFLVFSAFTTYAAYALLQRRNWARQTFIVLFALSIAWNVLFGAVAVFGFGMTDFLGAGGSTAPPELRVLFKGMAVAFAIFAFAMAAVFVWLIKRLRSPAIRAEFITMPPGMEQGV